MDWTWDVVESKLCWPVNRYKITYNKQELKKTRCKYIIVKAYYSMLVSCTYWHTCDQKLKVLFVKTSRHHNYTISKAALAKLWHTMLSHAVNDTRFCVTGSALKLAPPASEKL